MILTSFYGLNFIISNKSKKRLTQHGKLCKSRTKKKINPGDVDGGKKIDLFAESFLWSKPGNENVL